MTVLKDALYNLHPESGTDEMYNKGLIVGVMAAVMELKKLEFEEAIKYLNKNGYFPEFIDYESFPEGWSATFIKVFLSE